MLNNSEAYFFYKWMHQANKRIFKSYRVSKKRKKWAYFVTAIDIFGYDQNIRFPKKFFLCDVENYRSLFSNMNKPC